MKKLILGLSFWLLIGHFGHGVAYDQLNSKILAGQDVNMTLPWMAGMYISNSNPNCLHSDGCYDRYVFSCAAALIEQQWLVTAAHCVTNSGGVIDPQSINLFLGEYELQDVVKYQSVDQIIVHEQYGIAEDYKYDIALLKLTDPVLFYPIEIITEGKESLVTPGVSLMLAGWGRGILDQFYYYPDQLQMTDLDFVESMACREIFSPYTQLDDTQMCAGGDGVHDACDGDSGGPLIVNIAGRWKLVGLVSFGIDVCALEGFPTVFTRLSQYKQWITDQGVPANKSELGSMQWQWLFLLIFMMICRRLQLK